MKKLLFGISALIALLTFSACGGTDDYPGGARTETTTTTTSTDPFDSYKTSVSQLQKTSATDGFNIVIMCDGYTQKEIESGAYHAAVQKAEESIFSVEPMASLRKYCNVYEVVLTSQVSGITKKKQNTALETYIPDPDNSTTIEGSYNKVVMYTHNAIGKLQRAYDKTLAVVLVNSSEYAGTTLMACDSTVTDNIPGGFSVAYIPANASVGSKSYFDVLIQHEAVGHGIGKLADEYVYDQSPDEAHINQYNKGSKFGLYSNILYTTTATDDKHSWYYYEGGKKKSLDIYSHNIESTHPLYTLANDDDYKGEDLKWYRGGYTFKEHFYRPTINYIINDNANSFISIMGSSTLVGQKKFNVPSRLVIYKRIMKAANGNSWKCDISNATDFAAFKTFDAPSRSAFCFSSAKGAQPSNTLVTETANLPEFTAPRIINF